MVAKGFTRVQWVHFNEIFAPVVKHTSIRVILAIVAQQDLELEQIDVKTTFLHGFIEETIYMQQPEGYVHEDSKDMVCELNKALYGLKHSLRQW